MDSQPACPDCGAALPPNAPRGLCPRCLFELGQTPIPLSDDDPEALDRPGPDVVPGWTRFGDFDMIEEVGRGGMGVVYKARQRSLDRLVAIKLLAFGPMAGPDLIRRFCTEAAAAGALHHPNIVGVLEVGLHQGQHYIAMDYVDGPSLASLVRSQPLPVQHAATYLRIIAQAIQYAHEQGILHRDLKPSNILIGSDDRPRVADFGLARRLDADSSLTLTGHALGSPSYMPPEQWGLSTPNSAEPSSRTSSRTSSETLSHTSSHTSSEPSSPSPEPESSPTGLSIKVSTKVSTKAPTVDSTRGKITRRSDVYALGAILYHLLTGRPPFQAGTAAETMHLALNTEPPAPRLLNPILPRDLETICLKCLEKEPAKRYATAQALADDLERFLNDEPILARPVTRLERAVRWCRRKPALASAYGLLLLLLLLLSIASPIAAYRINEARRQAAEEADTARAMLAFLRDDLLSVADPFAGNTERPRGRNLTLLAAVDLAARNVRQRFPDQPLVEAGIRVTLWQVYFALGDLDRAEEHIQPALDLYDQSPGAPELERLKALESMAWMHHARGRYGEASTLLEPVLERRTRLQGADHPDVLSAQRCRMAILTSSSRHPEAIALGEDLLVRARQLPVEHTEVLLRIMNDMSWVWYRQGEFHQCNALSEEAFHIAEERLGRDHPQSIELMNGWATWLRVWLGRLHEAERLQQGAYDHAREVLGETHDLTLNSLSELALLADAKGLFGKKLEIQEHLVPLSRQAFGPDSPSAIFEQMRLAWSRLEEGRTEDANAALTEALERLRGTHGADSLLTLRGMRWLSGVFTAQDRHQEAIALRHEGVNRKRRLFDAKAHWTHMAFYQLANLHARIGEWQQAAQLYAEFLPYYDPAKSTRPREDLYAAGLVVSRLAGDDPATRTLGPLALRHARHTSHLWETRRELIVSLLLVAELASNTPELHSMASQFVANAPAVQGEVLLPGLLAFRGNEFATAIRILAPLSANPAHPDAGLASAVAAMAHHRLGNAREADNLLIHARNHLELLSRSGNLGRTIWYPHEEWLPVAQLALACREAELLIHGKRIDPIFDEYALAKARELWFPVKTLLNNVEHAASRGDWLNALHHLRTAIRHEYFAWSAAVQSRENFAAKAAALLASGGELRDHPGLTGRILHSDHNPAFRGAGTFILLQEDPLSSDSLGLLVSQDPVASEHSQGQEGGHPWWSLQVGLGELRAGNPQAALNALEPAASAYNLRCAGAAHAAAALALWQLGEHETAHQRLAQARDSFEQLTDGNRQSLGPNWHEMVFLELIMRRANEVLNNGG
jgi:eukaryotic-like serine/threonine-protein kinase